MPFNDLIERLKGGQGSGNFRHSGRLGKVGGSASGLVTMLNSLKHRLNVSTDVTIKVVDYIQGHEGIEAEYKPKDGVIYLAKTALNQNDGELGLKAKTVAEVLGSEALLAHELAHVKDGGWDKTITDSKKLVQLFLDHKTQVLDGNHEGVISKLSLSNPTEYFAEGMAVYATKPELLKSRNRELYAFIEGEL